MSKRVLCVGNCRPDQRAITAMLESQFAAEVVPAENLTESLDHLRNRPFDLVLVNRILDRDGSEGLEVIRHIKTTPDLSHLPLMLITNYPEHQEEAVASGAVEGFGKQALNSFQTRTKLESWLS